jgi:colicin import membrane protein
MAIKRPGANSAVQSERQVPAPAPAAEVEVEVAVAVDMSALLSQFGTMPVLDQSAFLRQAQALHEKSVKQSLKEAVKEGKAARKQKKEKDPNAPKREQSESVKAWLSYVQAVHAEMKAANPESKYGDAMTEASRRREAGDAAAPAKAEPKPKVKKAVDESGKAAAKEAKAAKAAADKEAKAADKEQKKADKEAEKAAKAAAKEAEKEAKEAAKQKAKVAVATKAKKPSVASAAAAAAAPAPAPAPSDEEEDLMPWTHKGVNYWRSAANDCWLRTADNQLGKWAGRFDTAKDKVVPAPEPKLA